MVFPPKTRPLKPAIGILFRKRAFLDTMKGLETRSLWVTQVGPKRNGTSVSYKETEEEQTQRRHGTWEAEWGHAATSQGPVCISHLLLRNRGPPNLVTEATPMSHLPVSAAELGASGSASLTRPRSQGQQVRCGPLQAPPSRAPTKRWTQALRVLLAVGQSPQLPATGASPWSWGQDGSQFP